MMDWWHDLKAGVRNVVRWLPVVWYDRDWDHSYLLRIMETKMRFMSIHMREYGQVTSALRSSRRLAVCAELSRRIREDNYLENLTGKVVSQMRFTPEYQRWSKMAQRNQKKDMAYLFRMMDKHLLGWWD